MKKVLVLLFLLLNLGACALMPVEEPVLPPPLLAAAEEANLRTAIVEYGNVVLYRNLVAFFAPVEEQTLIFDISGEEITAIYVAAGDWVNYGDVVAELNRNRFIYELARIDREEEILRLDLRHLEERRAAGLHAQDFSFQRDAIVTRLDILQVSREFLQGESESRLLLSGMDGTVVRTLPFERGMLSDSFRHVAVIADQAQSVLTVRVPEGYEIEFGKQYELLVSREPFVVYRIDPYEFGVARTAPNEAYFVFADGEMPSITPQTLMLLTIVLAQANDVLTVPAPAINTANERVFVYVLDDGGVRRIRDVEVGIVSGIVAEIRSGLYEGETVILGVLR